MLLFACASACLALPSAGCRQAPARPPVQARELHDVQATVRRFPIDSANFVLVPEDSSSTAYMPDELPIPFRRDGLQVIFSGQVPATTRHAAGFGTPITLTSIRRQDAGLPYSY